MEFDDVDILANKSAIKPDWFEAARIPDLVVPIDATTRFVLSFTIDQEAEYMKFFEEFGFVVIRDVLPKAEIDATRDDIWAYVEQGKWRKRQPPDVEYADRNKPHTWESSNWPTMANEGILGEPSVFTAQAFANRQNPTIYRAFSTILRRKDLWVNIDRYGLFRPTKNVAFGQRKVDCPQWKTVLNLHFDSNPWKYYNDALPAGEAFPRPNSYKTSSSCWCSEWNEGAKFSSLPLKVQGLVNILDNYDEDGGFQLVPGFAAHAQAWVKRTEATLGQRYSRYNGFMVLDGNIDFYRQARRIPMPAGSLIVWNAIMPHGSAPNDSDHPRMAQFIKMFPAQPVGQFDERRQALQEKLTASGVVVSSLGRKLFGLEDW